MLTNNQNKPAVDAQKKALRYKAEKFCKEAKRMYLRPKHLVLLDLMANYGLKIRDAREIYRQA